MIKLFQSHTKDCPKCKAPIEKSGGCNFMRCGKPNCRFEFCWLCLDDWKTHNDHFSCNRFGRGTKEQVTAEMQDSRTALTRYLHYYERYRNHQQSLKLESNVSSILCPSDYPDLSISAAREGLPEDGAAAEQGVHLRRVSTRSYSGYGTSMTISGRSSSSRSSMCSTDAAGL